MHATESTVLVVVEDQPVRDGLERFLKEQHCLVKAVASPRDALGILEADPDAVVVADLALGPSGLDLIRHVAENFPQAASIAVGRARRIDEAVEAIRAGASDCVVATCSANRLHAALARAHEKRRRRGAVKGPPPPQRVAAAGLIGEADVMLDVFRTIARAAGTAATVLITGESGTGKELVARAIHYSSRRASAAFVPVHCGGIPEGLLESELFGHLKGSFTGATESRIGFFQTADGGTIFLDEISEMSLTMQVKLLRVLQEREVRMVGSTRARSVDVRVLAATNKDLLTRVRQQLFREDLYFRLNVIAIEVPPLRDRHNDVLLLARHFVRRYAEEHGRPEPTFTDRAVQVLHRYAWPGNVRELENHIQRLVVMSDGNAIDVPDLPSHMRFSAVRRAALERSLAEVEADHIRSVLSHTGGNKTQAARVLGIDRKTLRDKVRRYGLETLPGHPDVSA
jgi:DNA-binding NtrC family response regulator